MELLLAVANMSEDVRTAAFMIAVCGNASQFDWTMFIIASFSLWQLDHVLLPI